MKTLIESRPPDLQELCGKLLGVRGLGVVAARGLALAEDPAIGGRLAKVYRKFSPQDRAALLDTLVSRPTFAKALLDEMAAGSIAKTDLTAFHARQIRGFENKTLTKQLIEVWGELRDSAADKKALVEKLKGDLKPDVLAAANLGKGRALYAAVCGACHIMYGEGGKIGPDLTGSGRANLDYLLENIVDPSAVVSADYVEKILLLAFDVVVGNASVFRFSVVDWADVFCACQRDAGNVDGAVALCWICFCYWWAEIKR